LKEILLVDDEAALRKALRMSLEQEGFQVTLAADGGEALDRAQTGVFDLILLDLMLPGVDGLTVCREIRKRSKVPVIMLTAKDEDIDKILGLEVGADDYVTKPFNTRELIARIKALFRRIEDWTGPGAPRTIQVGDLSLHPLHRRAELAGTPLDLTPREYDLLEALASRPGRVFTRQQLLDTVWGYDFDGEDRTVDVHIRRLREKLEPVPSVPKYLHTRRGVGYYLEVLP
jgi:two-component system, OmpR family, response regulator VicR